MGATETPHAELANRVAQLEAAIAALRAEVNRAMSERPSDLSSLPHQHGITESLEDRVRQNLAELATASAVLGSEIGRHPDVGHALRESEQRYQTLFDHIRSGVAVYQAVDDGDDFIFVDFNQAGERIENVTRSRIIGQRVTEVFPGIREMGLLDVLRQVWQTGQPASHPVTLYRDDRAIGWRENHVYRLPDGEVIAIFDDLTQQERDREERNRVFELSVDLLCVTGLDGYAKDVNPATERALGYTREELLSRPYLDFIHPEDRARTAAAVQKVTEGEQMIDFEVRFLHRDGSLRFVSWRAAPLTEAGLMYFVGRDVTDRYRTAQALREAQREWEDIFQAIGQPAIILDPRHGIIAANDTVIRAAGKPRNEILGRKCWEVFHGPDTTAPPSRCPLEQARTSGHLETAEMEQEAFGGTYLVTCTPILDSVGELTKIIHIATDITERKRTEQALRESGERLRLALRAAQMGTWEWNVLQNEVIWSPETERIFGLQPGHFGGTYEAYAGFAAPECLDEVNTYVRRFLDVSAEGAEISYQHPHHPRRRPTRLDRSARHALSRRSRPPGPHDRNLHRYHRTQTRRRGKGQARRPIASGPEDGSRRAVGGRRGS